MQGTGVCLHVDHAGLSARRQGHVRSHGAFFTGICTSLLQSCARTAGTQPCYPPHPFLATPLAPADKPERFDEVVEDQGVKIVIDSKALMHVLGTTMDYVEDRLRWAGRMVGSGWWVGWVGAGGG